MSRLRLTHSALAMALGMTVAPAWAQHHAHPAPNTEYNREDS